MRGGEVCIPECDLSDLAIEIANGVGSVEVGGGRIRSAAQEQINGGSGDIDARSAISTLAKNAVQIHVGVGPVRYARSHVPIAVVVGGMIGNHVSRVDKLEFSVVGIKTVFSARCAKGQPIGIVAVANDVLIARRCVRRIALKPTDDGQWNFPDRVQDGGEVAAADIDGTKPTVNGHSRVRTETCIRWSRHSRRGAGLIEAIGADAKRSIVGGDGKGVSWVARVGHGYCIIKAIIQDGVVL